MLSDNFDLPLERKQKLVSRYKYEHLFIGHMHFKGTDEREFYRLVRSSTAPVTRYRTCPHAQQPELSIAPLSSYLRLFKKPQNKAWGVCSPETGLKT